MSTKEQLVAEDWDDAFGEGGDSVAGTFDVREGVFFALMRFWPLVAGGLVVGTLAGLAFGFSKPNEFTSLGKIHLKLSEVEQRTLDSVLPDGTPGAYTTGMNDELELLRNPVVHERVARRLGAAGFLRPADPREQDTAGTNALFRWLHRAQSWWFARRAPAAGPDVDLSSESAVAAAAELAEAGVSIDAVPRSNIITVAYTSHDPAFTKRAVDAYLDVAQSWHRESFATNYQRAFLESEYQKRRAELDAAHARMAEHRAICKIDDLDLVQSSLIQQSVTLEQELQESEVRLSVIETELQSIARQLETSEPTVPELVQNEPDSDPAYQTALLELRRLMHELADLDEYVDTSEVYISRRDRLQRSIDEQNARLTEMEKDIALREPRTRWVLNPALTELSSKRGALSLERDGLRVSIPANGERLTKLRERLDQTAMCVKPHHFLQLDLDAAEAHVKAISSQLQKEVTLDTITDQERINSLTVIQRGTLPTVKNGPERVKFVLAGLFAGGALAAALAVLLQLSSGRVRYGAGLERHLGAELLAVVPESRDLRRARGAGP